VWGRGLLLGFDFGRPAREIQHALFAHRILTGTSADPNVLRLLPPLSFTIPEADRLRAGCAGTRVMKRDFLAVEDWSVDEIEALFQLAARLKRGEVKGGLERKVLAMVFLDPSLRTRTSFEAAMFLHGGHAVVLEPGKGSWALETEDGVVMDQDSVEHVTEAARVLGRYADALAVRAFPRGTDWAVARQDAVIRKFAQHCERPVINLESSRRHPCRSWPTHSRPQGSGRRAGSASCSAGPGTRRPCPRPSRSAPRWPLPGWGWTSRSRRPRGVIWTPRTCR
jgi:hypothetical protein